MNDTLILDKGANEATFALIKTHMVKAGMAGLIITRAMELRLSIIGACFTTLNGEQINALYGQHRRKPYWSALVASVSGSVVPMVLIGPGAVARWRELLGATNPAEAHPASLRGSYGNHHLIAENVAHGSDSREAAERELEIFVPRAITLRTP